MALEPDGIRLVAEGAAEFIAQLTQADASLSSFIEKLAATSRIRTPSLAPDLRAIQEAAALAASAGGKLSDSLSKVGQDATSIQEPLAEAVRGSQQLAEQLNAVSRISTAGVVKQVQEVQQAVQAAAGQAGVLRNQLQAGISNPGQQLQESLLQTRLAQVRAEPRLTPTSGANISNLTAERLAAAQAAAQFTAQRNEPSVVRLPRNADDTVHVERQQSAVTAVNIALQRYIALLRDAVTGNRTLAAATKESVDSEEEQANAQGRTNSSGVSYLSTLSAIHAASFLLGNQTFTTAGSLVTLSLAFSKLGPVGVIAGAAFGTAAVAIRSLIDAFQFLVNVAEGALNIILQVGLGIGTAVAAGVSLAVKAAADLETQFALVRAVGGGTDKDLGSLKDTVITLSRTFGVSATDVAQAASLYVRAGGTIQDAINGATEAVVKLTVASAGELGAPQAARAVAQIQNAFKVGPGEAADFIAGLAQKTTLSFTEVTQAIQQVGPVAANAKIPLLDIGAAIGVAAEAGLRGTVAGSSLKQVIADLAKPSKEAGKLLEQYNISLTDTSGNIRPLVDIFNDLNQAFGEGAVSAGKITDAQRLLALTTIFGSRAGQAAQIIAKAGASAFLEMRDGIAAVTATDIANQLLIPTSKQLEITKQNALALATAFGGPLNAAIGLGLNQFNKFLQTIGTQPFQVAGQAIVALATGSGFGQLSKSLDDLVSNSDTRQFIDSLLNTFLTLRDTVVSTVVPAIVDAGNTIGTSIQDIDFSSVLTNIARAGLVVGNVTAFIIGQFADLVSSIVENRDRGAELRNTVVGLASAFGTSLVGGLASAAVPVVIMLALLNSIGKAVLDVAGHLSTFDSLWAAGWSIAQQVIAEFFNFVNPKFKAFVDFLTALSSGDVAKVKVAFDTLEAVSHADFTASTKGLKTSLADVNKELDALHTRREELHTLQANIGPATGAVGQFTPIGLGTPESVQAELDRLTEKERNLLTQQQLLQRQSTSGLSSTIDGFKDLVKGAQGAAEAAQGFDLSDITARADGNISDLLSRITSIPSAIDAAQRNSNEFGGDSTTPGFLPDAKAAGNLTAKIVEFVSDMTTRINNLEEDGSTNAEKLFTNSTERLLDSFNKFKQRIADIDKQTNQRIGEIQQDAAIQRAERNVVESFQRDQEDESEARKNNLDIQELGHQHYLSRIDAARQRDTQNLQRSFDINQQINQRYYDTVVQVADIAFQRVQQKQQEKFNDTQSDEERKFREQQKKQADARQLNLQLAAAKTPEERTNILKQSDQAKKDADFSKGQETELLAFQRQQRDRATKFQQGLEDQAFSRRLQQQVAEFNFRLALEVKAIQFRRDLEDQEVGITEKKDFDELIRRQGLSRKDTEFRRGQQDQLKTLQNAIDDFNTDRQITNVKRAAQEQKNQATQAFATEQQRNIREVFESLNQLGVSQSKTVRGVLDTIADKRDDFIKEAAKNGIPLPPEFFQLDLLENKVLELSAAFEAANAAKRQLLGQQFGSTVTSAIDAVPSVRQPLPVQPGSFIPASALALSQAIGLPPETFTKLPQAVAQGTLDGVRQAAAAGYLRPQLPTVPTNNDPIVDRALDGLRRTLQGGR